MKVIAINGSPRKSRNTATLLEKALEGAKAAGAETEIVHLHDLTFKGCVSCFSCKRIGGKSYGKCAVKDDLSPLLEKLADADVVIIGSPIYFGNITGETRSFLERLLFQYLVYDGKYSSIAPKKMKTAFIYSMNVNAELMEKMHYASNLKTMEFALERGFGSNEVLYCYDTFQFDDYSKYESSAFDPVHKAKVRDDQFPVDCRLAFELGSKLASAKE